MSSIRDLARDESCYCIGPRNGEPLCRCMMRGVFQRNGRWIKPEQDLGPVKPDLAKDLRDRWDKLYDV